MRILTANYARWLAVLVLVASLLGAVPGTSVAQAQYLYNVVYVFGNTAMDGATPQDGLTVGPGGSIFGVTYLGGSSGKGTVFSVQPPGVYQSLYSFGSKGSFDGTFPIGGLTADGIGGLYGTTFSDTSQYLLGTIYHIDASGNESIVFNFLGSFCYNPQGRLLLDSAGNIYGTTTEGGPGNSSYGSVYVLSTSGQFIPLHGFIYQEGARPTAGVTMDASGNLYGTCPMGGPNGQGVLYKIDTNNHNRYTILFAFGGTYGSQPFSGVVLTGDGSLIGTTRSGGKYGYGVVYKFDSSGNESVLYNFTGGVDGAYPLYGTLYRDANGNLFGTTSAGGAHGMGTVFELDASGNYTVLYSFDYLDGDAPYGGVVADANGNLWGTTYAGGNNGRGWGVVFELTPDTGNRNVTNLVFTPNPVSGGQHLEGTVTIDHPAPPGGTKVTLKSTNSSVIAVPSSVTVKAGATTAPIEAKSTPVQTDTYVPISARTNGNTIFSRTIIVAVASLESVSVSPNVVQGGDSLYCTVTLTSAAPDDNAVVTLTVSSPDAQAPATVTIPGGQTYATFLITTLSVTKKQKVTITAAWGGIKRTSHFEIVP